jgi:hypothetical protein
MSAETQAATTDTATETDTEPATLAELDDRDVRALTETMTVLGETAPAPADAPGLYLVTTASGSSYTVDPDLGACECPDAEYRDATCKHVRRVRFERGARQVPPSATRAALDDDFRLFVAPEGQR